MRVTVKSNNLRKKIHIYFSTRILTYIRLYWMKKLLGFWSMHANVHNFFNYPEINVMFCYFVRTKFIWLIDWHVEHTQTHTYIQAKIHPNIHWLSILLIFCEWALERFLLVLLVISFSEESEDVQYITIHEMMKV